MYLCPQTKTSMKKYKLSLSEEDDDQNILVGIRTSLEIYRLAYLLNQNVSVAFSRCDNFFNAETQTNFALYQWENIDEERWYLVENQIKKKEFVSVGFWQELEQSQTICFAKEYKKIDYFLKIENVSNFFDLEKFLENLRQIPQIQYVQNIELNTLKNKNKFIFKKY